MKGRIKASPNDTGWSASPMCRVSINKKKSYDTETDISLGNFVKKVKSVDFSDKYFPGAVKVTIKPADNEEFDNVANGWTRRDAFIISGKGMPFMWACSEGIVKAGLNRHRELYVKVNR